MGRSSRSRKRRSGVDKPPWMEGVAWLMVAFVGGMMLYFGTGAILNGMHSRSWPSATAHVTESRVSTERVRHSRRRSSKRKYRHHFEYAFEVNQQRYVGDRIEFLTSHLFSFQSDAHAQQETYPRGAAVTVYYEPADPTNAVIIRGFPAKSVAYVIFGILILGVAGFFAFTRKDKWLRKTD